MPFLYASVSRKTIIMLNKRLLFPIFLFWLLSLSLPGCDRTPAQKALVTFHFDHPYMTQYTMAKPLFDTKNVKATLMVNIAEVGKSEHFMSWDQLKEMHDEGWEIGAHTVNHPDLRSVNKAEIRYELSQGRKMLETHGFKIENFAYPYNFYDMDALYIVSEYYRSARTSVAQTGFRINPEKIHPYELSAYEARFSIDNIDDAYKHVDKAANEGRWLIFILHEFIDDDNTGTALTKETSDIKAMEMLIDYIQSRNIPIVTTREALDHYLGPE